MTSNSIAVALAVTVSPHRVAYTDRGLVWLVIHPQTFNLFLFDFRTARTDTRALKPSRYTGRVGSHSAETCP